MENVTGANEAYKGHVVTSYFPTTKAPTVSSKNAAISIAVIVALGAIIGVSAYFTHFYQGIAGRTVLEVAGGGLIVSALITLRLRAITKKEEKEQRYRIISTEQQEPEQVGPKALDRSRSSMDVNKEFAGIERARELSFHRKEFEDHINGLSHIWAIKLGEKVAWVEQRANETGVEAFERTWREVVGKTRKIPDDVIRFASRTTGMVVTQRVMKEHKGYMTMNAPIVTEGVAGSKESKELYIVDANLPQQVKIYGHYRMALTPMGVDPAEAQPGQKGFVNAKIIVQEGHDSVQIWMDAPTVQAQKFNV